MNETTRMTEMTEAEYVVFAARNLADFAESRAKSAGLSLDDARVSAAKIISGLLPLGRATAGHYFYHLREGDAIVGSLWFGLKSEGRLRSAFIYEIIVPESARSRGYGSKMIEWLKVRARELDCNEIALNVFGFNVDALRLYERVGFETKSRYMALPV